MEKNSEFGYHQHPSLFGFHPKISHLDTKSVCEIPQSVEESPFMFSLPRFQHLNTNNTLPHHNLFPSLFNPTVPSMISTPPEKKFLVFDQSHTKTTMFYFSDILFGASQVLKNPTTNHKLSGEEGHTRVSNSNSSNPPLRQSVDNYEATKDEMHEDTEELDALLYSGDEYDDDDDEEKSTGHSPSTVTSGSRGPVQETEEEVDSFAVRSSTKRRRIPDEPTALGDDAAESVYRGFDKRVKRDKIHETLRVLRGLIPGTEGKDVVAFIDEAVEYLRSLKVQAKALGLDAL